MKATKDRPGWDISSWVWHRLIVEIGDPLTDSLMGLFLIEEIGIFPDNLRQMPTMKLIPKEIPVENTFERMQVAYKFVQKQI